MIIHVCMANHISYLQAGDLPKYTISIIGIRLHFLAETGQIVPTHFDNNFQHHFLYYSHRFPIKRLI